MFMGRGIQGLQHLRILRGIPCRATERLTFHLRRAMRGQVNLLFNVFLPLALRTTTLHHRPPAVAAAAATAAAVAAAAAAAMPCPSGCGNASAAAIPSWSTTCQAPARRDQLPSSATESRTRSTRAMTIRLIAISTMKLRQVFAPFT